MNNQVEKQNANSIKVVDGIFLSINKIVLVNKHSVAYGISVQAPGECFSFQVSENNIRRTRFLRNIALGDIDEDELYTQLREKILRKQFDEKDIRYQTDRNGLQQVNNKWVFVFSNGSICKKGFDPQIYSGVEGYFLPPETIMGPKEVKEVIKEMFREYNHNPKVFYPLFLLNIMAITNGYFKKIGESAFMKITLWLAGDSGSGKTSLAKVVSAYLFEDEELNSNFVSATTNRNYVLKSLCDSSGSVFLFDDVKKESVRERKNSAQIKIDDILRSVFNGRLTDVMRGQPKAQLIDTCALITGEYMQTQESQNARLLYLNVDGFLKEPRNSEILRTLQKNPLWVTTVCAGYIKWLITKMEDNDFETLIIDKLSEMRNGNRIYGDIGNAARLNENRYMVEMAYVLLEKYFSENDLTHEFIARCNEAAELAIESLCDNTFALLGGEQMVVQKALYNVVRDCKVRTARYQNNMKYADSGYKYRQDYFMLQEDDDILFIEDYEKSLLRNPQVQHDLSVGKPYVIIREERLMRLLYLAVNDVLNEYPVSCVSADEMIDHLPMLLKKMQIIYKQRRSDGYWGRTAVKYPVCIVRDENNGKFNYGEPMMERRCIVEYKPAIQINIGHPYMEILMERIDDLMVEEILPDIDKICGLDKKEIDEDELYQVRRAFMSGKVLHKE